MNKKGNLKMWQFSVTRHEKRSPRIGTDFEPVKQWTEEELRKEFSNVCLDPLGFTAEQAHQYYENILKPIPVSQQEKLFDSTNPIDGWRSFRKGAKSSGSTSPVGASSGGGSGNSGNDDGDDVIQY